MRLLLFASIIFLFSLQCQAGPTPSTSGNDFRRFCAAVAAKSEPGPDFMTGTCYGYIDGVMEGITYSRAYAQAKAGKSVVPRLFCQPASVENGQIIRIVLKYIDDNPKDSHLPTAALLIDAMTAAFPCH
jgi:hypothetical protein